MRYLRPFTLFSHLLKARAKGPARLLGLDVGDKYVGVAVSDTNNKIASPLSVLLRKKTNIDLMGEDFQSLITELSISGFVVGCPLDRLRSTASDGWQVKLLLEELSRTGKLKGVCYTYWNESFSTKLDGELLLKPTNFHQVQLKTIVDKFAAVGILQWYLDHANKKEKLNLLRITVRPSGGS